MRRNGVLLGLAAAGLASTVGAALSERKLLRRMAAIDPPAGWTAPRFPSERELMVPTDDGAELRVGVAGPDTAPTIVLVHGLTSSFDDWGPVANLLLDAGYRVVGINQRGHGGSSVGSEGFSPARLGADLGQALTALDLGDVTLVGHSMGGVAAMALLGLRPETGADRAARLVLVSTLADTSGVDRRLTLRLGNTQPYHDLADHPLHAPAVARFVFGRTPSRVLVDHALESNRRCPRSTRVAAALGLLGYDITAALPTLTTPTVVICGTLDRLTPLRENKAIAAAIPRARFIAVEGAGHLVIWENPQTVADAISAHTTTSRPPLHA